MSGPGLSEGKLRQGWAWGSQRLGLHNRLVRKGEGFCLIKLEMEKLMDHKSLPEFTVSTLGRGLGGRVDHSSGPFGNDWIKTKQVSAIW